MFDLIVVRQAKQDIVDSAGRLVSDTVKLRNGMIEPETVAEKLRVILGNVELIREQLDLEL